MSQFSSRGLRPLALPPAKTKKKKKRKGKGNCVIKNEMSSSYFGAGHGVALVVIPHQD